jgi:glycosyltransferase involved in cell wall biosynthesis
MKILHVIFSCNRLDYLTKSLESLKNLDYGNHEVTRIIVDDYPQTRNNAIFDLIAKTHRAKLWLNEQNEGLSVTWSYFFDWLKSQDYDYILHQEDDVLLLEPTSIDDLIQILKSEEKMASVVLQRQPWYFDEKESRIEETDTQIGKYYYSKNTKTFPIIFTLYRKNIIEYPFREHWGFNLNEGMIMVYLDIFHKMFSATLKGERGQNLIEHIGERCTGKRILEGEPNWEQFAHMDPNKFYSSRNGKPLET